MRVFRSSNSTTKLNSSRLMFPNKRQIHNDFPDYELLFCCLIADMHIIMCVNATSSKNVRTVTNMAILNCLT